MLVGVLYSICPTEGSPPSSRTSSPAIHEVDPDKEQRKHWWTPQPGAGDKMKALLTCPTFICAVLLITMAGVIKGAVEEMLPFHADHQWGYDPMMIGKLFCCTAIAYFVASAMVSQVWMGIGRHQITFSANCIFLLGATAMMSFHVSFYYHSDTILFATFASYGFAAGLTFTAAAQLIAEVVDAAEGHAKDAANGMWNTMWEFGGSLGFFMGGFLAHHYKEQMMLTWRFAIASFVTAVCMIVASRSLPGRHGAFEKEGFEREEKLHISAASYGSTA